MKKMNKSKVAKLTGIPYTTICTWIEKDNIPELSRPYVCLKLGIDVNKNPLEYIKKVIANDNEEPKDVA